ncbi:MAG: DnaA/Hda family protein [Peptococcaceae bacterium]|nr:DnaA/Hda family protein [Peptococcaceae bacterium]
MGQPNFFVAPSNSQAYQVVANLNVDTLPPATLIYGTQGSGKTSLLLMLQAELAQRGQKVLCVDALDFSRRYAFAAQKRILPAFRHTMRSNSIFLCDNMERICGKEKSMEELMYTCEGIWVKGGHVIATLNTERLTLREFGPRLASRLCVGISAHIEKPSPEEVRAFLEWRQERGSPVRDSRSGSEGNHEPADCYRGLHFGQIARYLDRLDEREEWIPGNFEEITERMMAISWYGFGVEEDELRGPSRGVKIVRLRSIQYTILYNKGYTQREIACYYRQGRDAVARGCARLRANWSEFEEDYDFFINELRGSLI